VVGPPPIWHYFAFRTDPRDFARECGYYALYLAYQFPLAGLALGALGIADLLRTRRRTALFLLVALGTNALLFLKTTEWTRPGSTKYTFYIHDYVIYAIFIGAGARAVASRWPRLKTLVLASVVLLPVGLYALMPAAVSTLGLDLVGARNLPYRDNARFFLEPSKRGERSAETYAREAFRVAGENATVIADYTIYPG
jgi:hypothetical protein